MDGAQPIERIVIMIEYISIELRLRRAHEEKENHNYLAREMVNRMNGDVGKKKMLDVQFMSDRTPKRSTSI